MGTFLITTAIITLLGYDLFLSMMIAMKEHVSVFGLMILTMSLMPVLNLVIYVIYIIMISDKDNKDMLREVKHVKSFHGIILKIIC